jgi:hypothetical protein
MRAAGVKDAEAAAQSPARWCDGSRKLALATDVIDHLAEILAVLHFGFFRAGSSSSAKQRYPPSDTLGRARERAV